MPSPSPTRVEEREGHKERRRSRSRSPRRSPTRKPKSFSGLKYKNDDRSDRRRDRPSDRDRRDSNRAHDSKRHDDHRDPRRDSDRQRSSRDRDHNRDRDGDRERKPRDSKPREPREKKPPAPAAAVSNEPMIIVTVNDRLGTKTQVPCLPSDPILLLKTMIAAKIGRPVHEIMLKRQGERPFNDKLSLADYSISNGVQIDLELNTGD